MKEAIIFGSSGFVGSHLLSELVRSSDYEQVTAVVRKNLNISHPKLKTLIANPVNVVVIPHRNYMHCRQYDTPSHLHLGGPTNSSLCLRQAVTQLLTQLSTSLHTESQANGVYICTNQYGCRTTSAHGRFPSSARASADNPPNAARLTIRSAPSTSTCRTDRHTATTASAPVQNTPWAHTPNPTQSLSTCQSEMCRFHSENSRFRPIVRNQPFAAQLFRDASERSTNNQQISKEWAQRSGERLGGNLNWVGAAA